MGRASEQMEGKDPEKDEDKHLWKHWALLIASSDDHSFLQKTLLSFSGNQMENMERESPLRPLICPGF